MSKQQQSKRRRKQTEWGMGYDPKGGTLESSAILQGYLFHHKMDETKSHADLVVITSNSLNVDEGMVKLAVYDYHKDQRQKETEK